MTCCFHNFSKHWLSSPALAKCYYLLGRTQIHFPGKLIFHKCIPSIWLRQNILKGKNPEALSRLLQLPDLKYVCGAVPTVGNLPGGWLEKQSVPTPFLCSPQDVLHGGQKPLSNRHTQLQCIPRSFVHLVVPPLFSSMALPRAGKQCSQFGLSSFHAHPFLPHVRSVTKSLQVFFPICSYVFLCPIYHHLGYPTPPLPHFSDHSPSP